MNVKLPYGTSAENDQLNLEPGYITIDTERKAIRLFDGVTQGGFEVVGTQAWSTPFKGVVSGDDLISNADLTTMVGLTQGTMINASEGWLHFVDPLDNKTKYIAKKPFRYAVSANSLANAIIFRGERTITIGDKEYIIRVMNGATGNLSGLPNGWGSNNSGVTTNSEWNRLMYPINDGTWASLSAVDLGLINNGRQSWCMEHNGSGAIVTRGSNAITRIDMIISSGAYGTSGWRPVLELVE